MVLLAADARGRWCCSQPRGVAPLPARPSVLLERRRCSAHDGVVSRRAVLFVALAGAVVRAAPRGTVLPRVGRCCPARDGVAPLGRRCSSRSRPKVLPWAGGARSWWCCSRPGVSHHCSRGRCCAPTGGVARRARGRRCCSRAGGVGRRRRCCPGRDGARRGCCSSRTRPVCFSPPARCHAVARAGPEVLVVAVAVAPGETVLRQAGSVARRSRGRCVARRRRRCSQVRGVTPLRARCRRCCSRPSVLFAAVGVASRRAVLFVALAASGVAPGAVTGKCCLRPVVLLGAFAAVGCCRPVALGHARHNIDGDRRSMCGPTGRLRCCASG